MKLNNKIIMMIPIIIITTFVNVFVSYATGVVIFLHLLSTGHKTVAPIISLILGVAVYFYILYNHKFKIYN